MQALGIDVVLVLPDAKGLGLDLYQFSEGVLQAPGNRNGATNGQVQVRELLLRRARRRID